MLDFRLRRVLPDGAEPYHSREFTRLKKLSSQGEVYANRLLLVEGQFRSGFEGRVVTLEEREYGLERTGFQLIDLGVEECDDVVHAFENTSGLLAHLRLEGYGPRNIEQAWIVTPTKRYFSWKTDEDVCLVRRALTGEERRSVGRGKDLNLFFGWADRTRLHSANFREVDWQVEFVRPPL